MRDIAPPGYLTFLKAVELWASTKFSGKPKDEVFEKSVDRLRQELQAGRLRAYLLVVPPALHTSFRSKAPSDDDGELLEIEERYWRTLNTAGWNAPAIMGVRVEAPVLKPFLPNAPRKVTRGGYVLLEEKAIKAHILGDKTSESDGPAMEKARSAARQAVAAGSHLTKEKLRGALQGVSVSNKGFDRIYGIVKKEQPRAFKGPGRPPK